MDSLLSALFLSVGISITYIVGAWLWRRLHGMVEHTICVHVTCDAYSWLKEWLVDNARNNKSVRRLYCMLKNRDSDLQYVLDLEETMWFQWKGTWCYCVQQIDTTSGKLHGRQHTLVLGTYDVRVGKLVLQDFLGHLRQETKRKNASTTRVFFSDPDQTRIVARTESDQINWWLKNLRLPIRDITSVVLDVDVKYEIMADAEWFLQAKKWYRDRHIPWRRGYLLYGPPGCGKSSMIFALAGLLGLDICLISLSANELTDDALAMMLRQLPSVCIVVLEDIDTAMCIRDPMGEEKNQFGTRRYGLTLSGLLNALDGVAAGEGRLVYLTTNCKDKLPESLVRPGRVDRTFEFPLASVQQARDMYQNFFPGCDLKEAIQFSESVGERKLSPAVIQGQLLARCNVRQQKEQS